MSIEERGRALENAFFAEKDRDLLEQLKSQLDLSTQRDKLSAATGITDAAVLDELAAASLNAESIAALSLAPLVLVAWADGKIESAERDAILKSAEQSGVRSESAAGQMLSNWLEEKPAENLAELWKDYVQAIGEKLPIGEKIKLVEQLLDRCTEVAEAAGGFLGLGSIAASEKAVLDELRTVLKS